MAGSKTVRVVVNTNAVSVDEQYGSKRSAVLPQTAFDAAHAEISRWPGYRPTPLIRLPGQAAALGIADLLYKDEASRFGLGSFKALGGAYAVMRLLCQQLATAGVREPVTSADLIGGRYSKLVRSITVTSATDGNHGRSVAWGARMFGCRCVIFIHEHVSDHRRQAIEAYGADVIRTNGGYDDSVRHAFAEARQHDWFVIQDTATADYIEAPRDITTGYGVIATEIMMQMEQPPTHVFVQAGVGGLASAICAQFWLRWSPRPKFIVLEPTRADCVSQSLARGRRVDVVITEETVMAGLSCGEVSTLAWDILKDGADAAIAIDDRYAIEGMQAFATPVGGDPAIVAGECSGGGLGALLALHQRPDLRALLGIDSPSSVLLIGTEGATDPAIYAQAVGRTPREVVAS